VRRRVGLCSAECIENVKVARIHELMGIFFRQSLNQAVDLLFLVIRQARLVDLS
jgi:hypothetical protein